jgi:predicted nucleic acid-binding Zn ribbon protein
MIRSSQVICPTCNGNVAMRVNRVGFWQRHVLGYMGIYPWKCGACGSTFLYRRRGHGRESNQFESRPEVSGAEQERGQA